MFKKEFFFLCRKVPEQSDQEPSCYRYDRMKEVILMRRISVMNRGTICRICGKIGAKAVLIVLLAVLVCLFSQSQASSEREDPSGEAQSPEQSCD